MGIFNPLFSLTVEARHGAQQKGKVLKTQENIKEQQGNEPKGNFEKISWLKQKSEVGYIGAMGYFGEILVGF